jgi:N-acetylglucosamine kinase-like BadF-type ATPase
MQKILSVDAGGTASRALVTDEDGRCLGYGRAAGGNPTSAGLESAIESITRAATDAVERASGDAGTPTSAVVAHAGIRPPEFVRRLEEAFAELGFTGGTAFEGDLAATYFSGSIEPDGYALIAGTGTITARVAGGEVDVVIGGTGWLVGDGGSGFWIGHRAARAVVAELDGLGPATALTPLVLARLGLDPSTERRDGRNVALKGLMDAVYGDKPVALSRLAPLVFEVATDPVARGILDEAAEEIAHLLAAARATGRPGPVVIGGGILAAGLAMPDSPFEEGIRAIVGQAELIPVVDGTIGAAVLGLRRAGAAVTTERFERVRTTLASLR